MRAQTMLSASQGTKTDLGWGLTGTSKLFSQFRILQLHRELSFHQHCVSSVDTMHCRITSASTQTEWKRLMLRSHPVMLLNHLLPTNPLTCGMVQTLSQPFVYQTKTVFKELLLIDCWFNSIFWFSGLQSAFFNLLKLFDSTGIFDFYYQMIIYLVIFKCFILYKPISQNSQERESCWNNH